MLNDLLITLFPATAENEDERFLEQILRITLLSLFIASFVALIAYLLLGNRALVRIFSLGLLLLLFDYGLVRLRRLQLAGIFIALALQGTLFCLILLGQGILDEAVLIFPLSFLISSLLLPRQLYVLFAFVTVSMATGIAYLQSIGRLGIPGGQVKIPTVVTIAVILLVTAVTARLLTSTLRKNLIRSRQNEKALAENTAYLTLLNLISDTLHRSLDPQIVAEQAAILIARHLNVPLVAIHTIDLDQQTLTPIAIEDKQGQVKVGLPLPLDQSLSGAAVRQKDTIITPDLRQDDRVHAASQEKFAAQGYQGVVVAPILLQDQALGTINLLYKTGQAIPPNIAVQLTPITHSIALALSEMSQHLAEATQDYGKTLNIIVRRLAELIGDSCSLSLISADGQWLEMAALYHPNPELVDAILEMIAANPQRIDEGHVGRVMETGQPLLIPESSFAELKETIKPEYRSLLERFPMYSRVMAPLRVQGQIIGITDLTRLTAGKTYTQEDVLFLQDLAGRAALAISNARLYAALQQELQERQRAEAAKEKLIGQLEAKNKELEHFAYAVSHDLKSPLVTIRGFLGFVEQDATQGNMERLRSDIQYINVAADKMHNLINELLELSRIGRLVNPPQQVDFGDLVDEAMGLVSGPLAAQHVVVDVAPDLPAVYVDRPRIVGALQNLIANAVKFMGKQAAPRIQIGAEQQGDDVVFFVQDNGIGIDPAFHEKVFGLFERLDPNVEGTGIGLALVKRIVEAHNGRIWIESAGHGSGATFYFTLPLAEESRHAS